MRNIPLKLKAIRSEIGWENQLSDSDQRRSVWSTEFNTYCENAGFDSDVVRNYKGHDEDDRILLNFRDKPVRLAERGKHTKGIWKDYELCDTWEFLVEDLDTDTKESVEAKLRAGLALAKQVFEDALESANKELADFDAERTKEAKAE